MVGRPGYERNTQSYIYLYIRIFWFSIFCHILFFVNSKLLLYNTRCPFPSMIYSFFSFLFTLYFCIFCLKFQLWLNLISLVLKKFHFCCCLSQKLKKNFLPQVVFVFAYREGKKHLKLKIIYIPFFLSLFSSYQRLNFL